jgi:formiminotetrahydrofolate cyclodeaminase
MPETTSAEPTVDTAAPRELTPEATSFGELTLQEFSARLASEEPVPGGGSASAAAGSLAGALLAMVAGLSTGRPKYAAYAATIERAKAAGERARRRLLELADEDATAYSRFGAARKLPRDSESQVAARKAAIAAAALAACEVPMAVVWEMRTLVDEIESLAGRSNLNAASDLEVAALLADAAAQGAGANVLINLPMVGDEDVAGPMTARLGGEQRAITDAVARVRRLVNSGELREPEAE